MTSKELRGFMIECWRVTTAKLNFAIFSMNTTERSAPADSSILNKNVVHTKLKVLNTFTLA